MNPWFSSFLKIFQNYCLFTLSGIVIQCWKFEGIRVNAAKLYTNIVCTRGYSLFCHSLLFKEIIPGTHSVYVVLTWATLFFLIPNDCRIKRSGVKNHWRNEFPRNGNCAVAFTVYFYNRAINYQNSWFTLMCVYSCGRIGLY